MKNRNTVSAMLWKSYIFMVVVAVVMMIVPYIICVVFLEKLNKIEAYQNCSAEDIMQDDYNKIDVTRIENLNGSIQVVTGNLDVITLCGEGVLQEKSLNYTEWTKFLINSGGVNDIDCDVVYNEKENFWLIVELPMVKIEARFVINKDLVEYDRIMRMLWLMFASYVLFVIASAICYSNMTAANFRKPFQKLCDYANMLEQGKYEKRVELKGLDEFKNLEQGMNHLAEELEKEKALRNQMEGNRNQLIRDISHDLKNPLMGIQGYAELCMGKEDITQQQLQDYLELIRNNSIRANELLMNLFDYAKLESADFALKREKVDFGEFLRQELIAWIPELENKHFSYEADIPEHALDVTIDVAQMKRVFSNLFGNAIKYNPEGTSIFLAVREVSGKCEIVFSDSGIGMDEEYAKTLFEPFSRPDKQVRNSRDGGSGLGLAIVKKIILLHGGEICVDTARNQGTKFLMTLPI